METVEVRVPYSLPINIEIRPNERLDKLAQRIAEHEREMHALEKQISTLTLAAQRLNGATYSIETSRQRAEIKRQLAVAEQRLLEQRTYRDRVQSERSQWLELIAGKEYTRRRLWEELAEARPGPASELQSYTQMYHNLGEPEKRTTGDVARDLRDVIGWLLNFGGEDATLLAELEQLREAQS